MSTYTDFIKFLKEYNRYKVEIFKLGQWSFCKNYKDQEYISIFIISILFLSQHNCICNRLVVYKQAYDTSQEDLTMSHHPHTTTNTASKSHSQKSKNLCT